MHAKTPRGKTANQRPGRKAGLSRGHLGTSGQSHGRADDPVGAAEAMSQGATGIGQREVPSDAWVGGYKGLMPGRYGPRSVDGLEYLRGLGMIARKFIKPRIALDQLIIGMVE